MNTNSIPVYIFGPHLEDEVAGFSYLRVGTCLKLEVDLQYVRKLYLSHTTVIVDLILPNGGYLAFQAKKIFKGYYSVDYEHYTTDPAPWVEVGIDINGMDEEDVKLELERLIRTHNRAIKQGFASINLLVEPHERYPRGDDKAESA